MIGLAGGKVPAVSGKSLAPAFQKDGTKTHDWLYFNHNNNRALRVGDTKLIATGKKGDWELYDLKKDRSEQHNLATDQSQVAAKLAAQWTSIDEGFTKTREAAPETTKARMKRASA